MAGKGAPAIIAQPGAGENVPRLQPLPPEPEGGGGMNMAMTMKPTRSPERVVAAYVTLRATDRAELLSGTLQTRDITQARHELMWVMHELTHCSLTEPHRVYRRVICSTTTRPYRVCSGLHRTPPLLLRVGCIRWGRGDGDCYTSPPISGFPIRLRAWISRGRSG